MEYKLNSFKTYKDNGELIVIGMIIALFMMLLPLAWKGEVKAESDLEIELENTEVEKQREPGMLTEDGDHQEMPPIQATTEHERFKEMANAYGLDASKIWMVEEYYGLTESLVLCITVAETSGGKRGAGGKNIGSVGSNDRGDRPTYALMESGLEAIGRTLTNRYLGKIQTLGCLSNAGNCASRDDRKYRYATSQSSREKNMVACLSQIYGPINPTTFNIRNR